MHRTNLLNLFMPSLPLMARAHKQPISCYFKILYNYILLNDNLIYCQDILNQDVGIFWDLYCQYALSTYTLSSTKCLYQLHSN